MVKQDVFYNKKIIKKNENRKNIVNYTGSYVFISFDIVNSTYFKTISKNWIEIFKSFFTEAENKVKAENENSELSFKLWKTLGDEILFYSPIMNIESISNIHKKVFIIMKDLITILEKENEAKGILSIKSGLWIAYLTDDQFKDGKEPKNIILKEKIRNEYKLEFLGSDIDTGFRILKYAQQNKLVICAKLAYLLSMIESNDNIKSKELLGLIEDTLKKDLNKNDMKIVSYEQLKGVWNNKYYPIVWYFDNWSSEDIFQYDEKYNSDIIKRIEKNKDSKEEISKLVKIFDNLNKKGEIEELINGINEYSKNNPKGIIHAKIEDEKLSELHLATICFNDKSDKILIVRRTDLRKYYPNRWEFGCAKLKLDKNFRESIKEDYQKELSIDLDLDENNLLPISSYELKKENRFIQGLIFIAKTNTKEIKLNEKKYSEFKWISLKELENIKKNEVVDDFHKNVEKAFEIVKPTN